MRKLVEYCVRSILESDNFHIFSDPLSFLLMYNHMWAWTSNDEYDDLDGTVPAQNKDIGVFTSFDSREDQREYRK